MRDVDSEWDDQSPADPAMLRQQAAQLKNELAEMSQSILELRKDEWKRVLKDRLGSFLEDPCVAQAALKNTTRDIQLAAIDILYYYWRLPEACLPVFVQLLTSSEDQSIRLHLITGLGSLYHDSFDSSISRILALIVANIKESLLLRVIAYQAILQIQGQFDITCALSDLSQLEAFLADVDWELLRNFL